MRRRPAAARNHPPRKTVPVQPETHYARSGDVSIASGGPHPCRKRYHQRPCAELNEELDEPPYYGRDPDRRGVRWGQRGRTALVPLRASSAAAASVPCGLRLAPGQGRDGVQDPLRRPCCPARAGRRLLALHAAPEGRQPVRRSGQRLAASGCSGSSSSGSRGCSARVRRLLCRGAGGDRGEREVRQLVAGVDRERSTGGRR